MSAANAFTVHKAAIEALVDRIHALSAPLILDDVATWRHVNAMAAAVVSQYQNKDWAYGIPIPFRSSEGSSARPPSERQRLLDDPEHRGLACFSFKCEWPNAGSSKCAFQYTSRSVVHYQAVFRAR